jgi:hypothetical protein
MRSGAGALATAGVMFILYPAVRPWHDESTVAGARESMASNTWVAAHLFGMVGFIAVALGLLALDGVVRSRLSRLALVVTWIGAGLTLPYYGAEDFGLHALANSSTPDLLDVIDRIRYQPVAITMFGAGLLALGVGAVLAAVAIWRSGVLPRWSGVLFAVGFALFLPQFYLPSAARITHGVLVAAGCFWLAVALLRSQPSAGAGVRRSAGASPPRTAEARNVRA